MKLKLPILLLWVSLSVYAADPSIQCSIVSEVEYQPITDETGKQILTSKKISEHCTETYTEQGPCKKWIYTEDETTIPDARGVGIEELDTSANVGSVLAIMGAVNQANAIFNGVKGHCEIGYTQDFSWLNDPALWASIAMSAVAAYGDTPSNIPESEKTTLNKFSDLVKDGYGGCAVTGALDMTSAALDYVNDDAEDCDPVDEFCDGTDGTVGLDPTMIQTLTQDEYNTLITENPEVINNIEIIDSGGTSGFVTIRIKEVSEVLNGQTFADDAAAEQAKQDAKKMQFKIKAGTAALKMAGCMGKEFGSDYVDIMKGDTGGTGAINADNPLLGMATGMLPFPYNSIATIALKVFESYDNIDSCHNEEDASAQGARHVKANRGIRFNTCHPIDLERVMEKWPVTGDSMRKGYDYCCFASPLAKILMVQIKAQVGKGWTHCTGVTPNELGHVSFKQCTANEMNPSVNGGYKDGATFLGIEGVDYDMKNSYQYHFQCMNLAELESYIESQVPVDFSQTHISEMLKDIQDGLR